MTSQLKLSPYRFTYPDVAVTVLRFAVVSDWGMVVTDETDQEVRTSVEELVTRHMLRVQPVQGRDLGPVGAAYLPTADGKLVLMGVDLAESAASYVALRDQTFQED